MKGKEHPMDLEDSHIREDGWTCVREVCEEKNHSQATLLRW